LELLLCPLLIGAIPGLQAANSGGNDNSSSKFQVLSALLLAVRDKAPTDRMVLVSNYTATLDLLAIMCNSNALSFVRLDGSTPQKKREAIVRQFNAGKSHPTTPVCLEV
jgi:SNF2 family DNA or RNA helicase